VSVRGLSLNSLSPAKGTTVLVVEDHADSADAMRQILTSLGARVVLAGDGLEGLVVLKRERPSIVLCDLRMPIMDGFQFIGHLRADPRFARLPVLAFTALGDGDDLMKTWQAGFDGHLTKPVDYDTVASTLERVLWAQGPPTGRRASA